MTIFANILLFDILYTSSTDSIYKKSIIQYFLTACLIASFVRDRLEQFMNKLYSFLMITITSWTVKKQRSNKALIAIVLNFIFLIPFGIILLIVASVISAPLLPLFTFPIFLIGFPRTKRFWPQRTKFFSYTTSATSNSKEIVLNSKKTLSTTDSSFYAQLVPKLLLSFRELIQSASIGNSIQPDTYFLSRFQDRIIWIQIMESSNSYYIINIKGLELQETSCHTRESQYIDDCFDLAFENTNGASANSSSSEKKCCLLNANPLNCMQSCDVLLFDAYSDAKNSLVGILDNPECINQLSLFYPKVLHYFLIKFLLGRKVKKSEQTINDSQNEIKNLFKPDDNNKQEKVINILDNAVLKSNKLPSIKSSTLDLDNQAFESTDKIFKNETKNSKDNNWDDSSESETEAVKQKKNSKTNKITTLKSSDENPFDFDLNEILGTSNAKENSTISKNIDIDMGNFNKADSSRSDYNVFLTEIDQKSKQLNTKPFKANKNLETSSLIEENSSLLKLPTEWTKFLNDNLNSSQSQLKDSEIMKTTVMSTNWVENILNLIETISINSDLKSKQKDLLLDYENGLNVSHFIFIKKCCLTLGLNENKVSPNINPFSMQKFYAGDLPWSPLNEKLAQDYGNLQDLLIKAFRYTIKLVIDHVTICPIENDDEFIDSIKTYEQDWFIGTETDTDYATNIINNKQYLFSLYKDPQKV